MNDFESLGANRGPTDCIISDAFESWKQSKVMCISPAAPVSATLALPGTQVCDIEYTLNAGFASFAVAKVNVQTYTLQRHQMSWKSVAYKIAFITSGGFV